MPSGRHKSGTFKKVHKRTPGGKTVIHYEHRKPKRAHCGSCGNVLSGVPRGRPTDLTSMAKSKKRPERPYGGMFCSRCLRIKIKSEVRK